MTDKMIFQLLIVVCSITHIVRTVYEILKHKKILKSSRLTFVIIFANMITLWVSWFLLCSKDPSGIEPASFYRYFGISLFGSGMVAFFLGLFTIKTLESYEGDLITNGIYSIVRHPMYLGFILWLLGFPIFFGSLFSLGISFLFILNVLFWRYLEEKELEERFPNYAEYKKNTLF